MTSYSSFGNPLIDVDDAPAPPAAPAKSEEVESTPAKTETTEKSDLNAEEKAAEKVTTAKKMPSMPAMPSMPSMPSVSMPAFLSTTKGSDMGKFLLPLLIIGVLLAFITIIVMSVWIQETKNPKIYPKLCTTSDCLYEASVLLENMNASLDPCQDFYKYSCANFPKNYPRTSFWQQLDWRGVISQKIDDTLQAGLEKPIKRPVDQTSVVTKMKQYYGTCRDLFTKTKLGAKPMIDIIKSLGGWGALYGTFNANQWTKAKLNSVIQTLQSQYYVQPFFQFLVSDDYETWTPGTSKTWLIWVKEQNGYRAFIKSYIQLLWKDAGITNKVPSPDQLIQTVTEDIIAVETFIANYSENHMKRFNSPHQKISFLDKNYGQVISWQPLVNAMFNMGGTDATIHIGTDVQNYLVEMSNFIPLLSISRINNYIMWKFAVRYIHELGWEYLSVNRVWAWIKYQGWVRYVGHDAWCLIELQRNMKYALSYMFIQDNFASADRNKVKTIFNYEKNQQVSRLQSSNYYSWMDSATKQKALKKYPGLVDKLGYADWMDDKTQVTQYYSTLAIKATTHFQNVINTYHFQMVKNAEKLAAHKIDRMLWPNDIWSVSYWYDVVYNQIYFPAGLLQKPIYNPRAPMHVNFGSIGVRVALEMLAAIEPPYGLSYDENGFYKPWWSAATTAGWWKANTCNGGLYNNTIFCEHGRCHKLNIRALPSTTHMSYAAAMNIAYNSFKNYFADNGPEPALPGLQSDSVEQTFFLAAVQTFCYNKDPYVEWAYWYWYRYPIYSQILNKVLANMPEFGQAFKCPAGSPMMNTTTCPQA